MDRPIHFVAIHVTMRCLLEPISLSARLTGRERMGQLTELACQISWPAWADHSKQSDHVPFAHRSILGCRNMWRCRMTQHVLLLSGQTSLAIALTSLFNLI